jgi:membrane-associated phospholipid phosphatase
VASAIAEELDEPSLVVDDPSPGKAPLVPDQLRKWVFGVTALAVASLASVGFATRHSVRPVLFDVAVGNFLGHSLTSFQRVELFLSDFGNPFVFSTIAAIVCISFLLLRDYRATVAVGASVLFARIAVEDVLKPFFGRHLVGVAGGPTFPSGHTTIAFALAGVVILASRRSRPLGRLLGAPLRLLLVAVMLGASSAIGISMIALHWHYATDVIVSVPLGLAIAGCTGMGVDAASDYLRSQRGRKWMRLPN